MNTKHVMLLEKVNSWPEAVTVRQKLKVLFLFVWCVVSKLIYHWIFQCMFIENLNHSTVNFFKVLKVGSFVELFLDN